MTKVGGAEVSPATPAEHLGRFKAFGWIFAWPASRFMRAGGSLSADPDAMRKLAAYICQQLERRGCLRQGR